jgi:hypothetical protein
MKSIQTVTMVILTTMFIGAACLEASDIVQYRAKPRESKMSIEGTSNVHDWLVEGWIIGGTLRAGPGFTTDPQLVQPGNLDLQGEVMIPVRTLKSVKDGKPYDSRMDDAMYEEMKMAEHPQIRYTLTQLALKELSQNAKDPFLLAAEGELTIAGVTRQISMPIQMRVPDENSLDFSGAVSLKMSDFGIGPVSRLGGLFRTGDEVKLMFRWVVGKR